MEKYIICDLYNVLLDSRHRQYSNAFFFSLIKKDNINYPILQLLKSAIKSNYKVIFFGYCSHRYEKTIIDILYKMGLKSEDYILHVDSPAFKVYDNTSLKKYYYLTTYKDKDVVYCLDFDEASINFWREQDLFVLKPLY